MSAEQEAHLRHLQGSFARLLERKYRAGAAQHGSDLLEMPIRQLLREAREEIADAWAYLDVIERRLKEIEPPAA